MFRRLLRWWNPDKARRLDRIEALEAFWQRETAALGTPNAKTPEELIRMRHMIADSFGERWRF